MAARSSTRTRRPVSYTHLRRNTDPTLRADVRLTVQKNYNSTIDNAYYAFTAEYGDVEVVMTQQTQDVVQAVSYTHLARGG